MKHLRPQSLDIVPRRARFDFSAVPRHWQNGDPFMTRLFDALSVHFPDGERFFITSVRQFEHLVRDEALQQQVRDFVKQEAQHGVIHSLYNRQMAEQGVKVDQLLQRMTEMIALFQKWLPKRHQLVMTAAFEHLTATLAEGLLETEVFETAQPDMRAMFLWHAVEEIEHKSVAFDVYESAAGGGYLARVVALLVGTVAVHLIVGVAMRHMLKVDGLAGRPKIIVNGIYRLYGPGGLFTSLLPAWLAWFRPGFHPTDSPIPPQIAQWRDIWVQNGDATEAADRIYMTGSTELPAATANGFSLAT